MTGPSSRISGASRWAGRPHEERRAGRGPHPARAPHGRCADRLQRERGGASVSPRRARAREQTLTRRLREAVAQDDPTDDLRYAFEVPEVPPPRERRYVVNDTTVEKLGELLNQNPNGLLLFRDELSGFLRLMARPATKRSGLLL